MKYTVLFVIVGQANGSPSSMATAHFEDASAAVEAADMFRMAASGRTNVIAHALVFPLRRKGGESDAWGTERPMT